MKLANLFLCAFLVLLMAASDPYEKSKGKIKVLCSSKDCDTMYYDGLGRLASYTASGGYKTTYTYTTSIVTESTAGGSNVTMFLNRQGLVDSLINIDPNREFENGSPKKSMRATRAIPYGGIHVLSYLDGGIAGRDAKIITKKFAYDKDGYLINETEFVNGHLWATSASHFSHGNLASYTMKYFFSDTISMIDRNTQKPETRVITLGTRTIMLSYNDKKNTLSTNSLYGKCSKNLTVRSLEYQGPSPSDSTVTTFNYTYDKEGRASTLIKSVKSTDPPQWNEDDKEGDKATFTYY